MIGISETNRKWWVLVAMSGVLGLTVLDETVVGVALATIRPELEMSAVASHWVVNAYFLTFTGFVAIGGRLGDSLGHRGFFVLGAAIFAAASLLAGLAPSGGWLIAARALQGVGAAITFPASLAIMTDSFPPGQRGLALGIQVSVAACFMSMGPLVGGYFSEVVSWRWIFWINLPVILAVVAIVLAALKPAGTQARAGPSMRDYRGLAILLAGLGALVIALMQGADWGWDAAATLILLVAGLLLLALFVVLEARTANPLIEVELLRIKTFTGGNLVFFMFQFDKLAVFVFVALYLQEVLKETPIDAGLLVVIGVAPTLVTSFLAGKLTDRLGARRPLMAGLLLNGTALCLIGLATLYHDKALILAPLVVWGAALPFIAIPARRALMSAVPQPKRGQAGGVNLTIQMLGGTVGVALCSALLAASGHYASLFLMTGALVLLVLVVAWLTIER